MSNNPLRFRLDDVRVAFPVLFKAEQFNGEGKFRCGATLLLGPDHPQLKQVEAAIEQAAREKWKDKAPAILKAARAKDKVALRDGDTKPKYDGFAGNWFVSANCRGGDTEAEAGKPKVYDANRNEVTDPAKNPIYSGCYVNAVVEFYADSRYGDGVFCTLAGIQFRRDGDAFGGAPAKADDFEAMDSGAMADDLA